MPGPRHLDPDLSPQHFFGAEFRRARDSRGISQASFAVLVPCDTSTVSRVETGEQAPGDRFVAAAAQAFPELDWLIRFYSASLKWPSTGPVPKWFEDYLRAEREAHTLRIWQMSLVPGPFQTADYARELFRVEQPDADDDRLEELVAARLGRQTVFEKPEPPYAWAAVDESVLHRLVGSPQIMHEQLMRVAELSARSYISIQVIEARDGVNPGQAGSFQIASVHGKPDLMLIEAVAEDQTTDRGTLIRKVGVAFDRLRGYALPCAASRDLILKVAEEKWNTRVKAGTSPATAGTAAAVASRSR